MEIKQIIQSQYLAALEMLKEAILACPDSLWNNPKDLNPTWDLAYHTLFYVHLYLQDTEEDFVPWEKHQPKDKRKLYTKDEILVYVTVVQEQVAEKVPALNLDAESGFYWLPFNKLELQFYSIRHVMQHAGELYERIGSHIEKELPWVGMYPLPKKKK